MSRNGHQATAVRPRRLTRGAGKRSRFDEFAAAHGAGLIRLALAVTGDRGRAEDAAQDALVRVYQRWSRLEDPLAYARRTVVNATRDDWRRAERARRALAAAGLVARSEEVEGVEEGVLQRDALMTAVHALPHGQRAVIVLRYLSDLTEAETAAVLEVSVGTVKSQAHDALTRLRGSLEPSPTTTIRERCS